jgi:hypothetical protein
MKWYASPMTMGLVLVYSKLNKYDVIDLYCRI